MEEKEEWRTYYKGPKVTWEVSDLGNVKRNGELYKPKIHKGYLHASIFGVHRMVAECFIPNPNNYNEVDHINGNKLDNRVCNLRWCTHKENMNNPISRKRMSESLNKPETRKRRSESMKGKNKGENNPMYGIPPSNKGKHRVYHEDRSYHYE